MNDVSCNPYVKAQNINIADYTLNTFLFDEIAVEIKADIEKLRFAIGNLLVMHGFDVRLSGFDFLIALITRYIVKSDYEEQHEIIDVAESFGTYPKYVRDCINATIRFNTRFVETVSKTLGIADVNNDNCGLSETVNIMGALFKIYYNYTVDGESLGNETQTFDYNRVIN